MLVACKVVACCDVVLSLTEIMTCNARMQEKNDLDPAPGSIMLRNIKDYDPFSIRILFSLSQIFTDSPRNQKSSKESIFELTEINDIFILS
jgi:hypothetical protein